MKATKGFVYGLMILFVVGVCFINESFAFLDMFSKYEKVKENAGLISIDVEKLKQNEVKYYLFEKDGKYIKLFVVRDENGTARMALDACEACYREEKGYTFTGSSMLCVNCGQKFQLARIGLAKGGCNPHPIAYKVDGNKLSMTTEALFDGVRFFPGNLK